MRNIKKQRKAMESNEKDKEKQWTAIKNNKKHQKTKKSKGKQWKDKEKQWKKQ